MALLWIAGAAGLGLILSHLQGKSETPKDTKSEAPTDTKLDTKSEVPPTPISDLKIPQPVPVPISAPVSSERTGSLSGSLAVQVSDVKVPVAPVPSGPVAPVSVPAPAVIGVPMAR